MAGEGRLRGAVHATICGFQGRHDPRNTAIDYMTRNELSCREIDNLLLGTLPQ